MSSTLKFWEAFIKNTHQKPDINYVSCFHFELTKSLANALLELVLKGQKKATASSLNAFIIEKEPLPKVGDFHIVTDWDGHPKCVIQTTQVTIMPFKDMTYEICKREGEDDTLKSWQAGHRRFYEAEGNALGYTFTEDMDIVFEDFEVVYKEEGTF